jgi:hypothetical protein
MKYIAIFSLALFCAAYSYAQNASEALRYSYLQPGGTARYLGAGGAFGALGAEFGAISQNPAGLALFRSDELILTPSLRFANTESRLNGNVYDDDKSKFGFDNIGIVFNTKPGGKNWKTFNFAIGYNRLADYNNAIYYEGDANGTILNGFFRDYSNGIADAYGAEVAAQTGAFFNDTTGVLTYDFAGNENALVNRSQALITSGRMNEMAVSFAGNYNEKLMVGLSIGVPFVNYRLDGEYVESDPQGNVEFFDRLAYTEYLRTSGLGINVKLGLIYRVSQALRLGASFHSPSALSLTDTYSTSFTYEYTDGTGYNASTANSPEGALPLDYKLRTPWRAGASAAVLIKKYGFLSADVEWVDYSANRFNLTSDISNQENQQYERAINADIQRLYQQTMNVRLGGELALDEFRIRGGYNLLGRPQEGASDFNTAITAGIGIRSQSYYIDLGWRRSQGEGTVRAYASAPVATTKTVANDFLLSVGFKF